MHKFRNHFWRSVCHHVITLTYPQKINFYQLPPLYNCGIRYNLAYALPDPMLDVIYARSLFRLGYNCLCQSRKVDTAYCKHMQPRKWHWQWQRQQKKIQMAIRLSANVGLWQLLCRVWDIWGHWAPYSPSPPLGRGRGVWGPMPSSIKIPLCNSYNVWT